MKSRSEWEREKDLALEWAKGKLDEALDMVDFCNKTDDDKRSRDSFQRDAWQLRFIVKTLKEAKEKPEKPEVSNDF